MGKDDCLAVGAGCDVTGQMPVIGDISGELFGANLRATVATTVPNFVRSTVIPLTALFLLLRSHIGIIHSALTLAGITFGIAIFALFYLEETFSKEMSDVE